MRRIIFKARVWAFVALTGLFLPSTIVSAGILDNDRSSMSRNLTVFNYLYKELSKYYVDTLDTEKTITGAIDYMLHTLDPYTEYIQEKDREDFMVISTGEYAGIGSTIAELRGAGKGVFITDPFENSPAAEAGLRPGDRIIMVDNDSTLTARSSEVSEKLKGQANTIVRVTVDRPYVEDSIRTFEITRRKIQIPSVPYYKAMDGIGYIVLTTFNENSPEEVKNALVELKRDPSVRSIVLDLRGNGGGVLESAVDIVGLFVPKNTEVVRTKGRMKDEEKVYRTKHKPVDEDMPLVVLIDSGSASASEIVAGSLQDLDRAVIVGTRSFGKGLVQSTRTLPFGNLLKLTVAKYYIPSGRLIQAIDYSHRNPDGSVGRIPDSLTTVYHTAAGREVRDGGGITPDVKVDYGEANRLTYNIVVDNWAFNFANKYAAEHPAIGDPERFVITDSLFDAFKKFVDPKRFNYDKVCEVRLEDLRKAAETEGYMTDSTKIVFDQLERLLKHNLDHDLDINRRDIEDILLPEILNRYYYQKGTLIGGLRYDAGMDSVRAVLGDLERYKSLLKPQTKDKKPVTEAAVAEAGRESEAQDARKEQED